jgi:hypothetical protein
MCRGFSPAYTEQEDINSQLNAVKLKLEERRKKIEDEKRKMEVRQGESVTFWYEFPDPRIRTSDGVGSDSGSCYFLQ